MKRSRGYRSKARHKLRKGVREKGTIPVSRVIQSFQVGDRVHIALEPSVHKGAVHPRFHGKTGVVSEKRGRSYLVEIMDGGMRKTVIAAPVHLRPQR